MRRGLDSLNERNRSDQPFTAADVQPYVDFFDSHGTSNDQLLAYYLLGRSYHEQGEAPMALKYYQQAIECADTTDADCDFGQLSRVYGQMGRLFYEQSLFRQYLSSSKIAERYSWKAKDTLAALICYEQQSVAYRELGNLDSSLFIAKTVANHYSKLGYHSDAAIALGGIVHTLIKMGRLLEARKCMAIYESESGLFNDFGDIEKGREIYYAVKGLYYLRTNCLDSAEYYYRKELTRGKDFNNQNGGALGLAMIYDLQQRKDSSSKYYSYAYAMNDSMYAQMVTDEIERMHAMYDYSNYQEIARKKTEEAREERLNRQIAIGSIVFIVLFFSFVTYFLIRKEKKGLKKYLSILQELKQMRYETKSLKLHETEYRKLILEKEERIAELEKYASKYGKQLYFTTANAERCLHESVTYKRIAVIAARGQRLTDTDWKDISMIIAEYLPGFEDFMEVNRPQLKANEYPLCILLRMHFKAVEIAGMLNLSKSQVSQLCSDIMRKVFDKKGSSKELSANLSKIF
jgi:tetratricopeptide (TPR) repeat protein